MATNKRRRPAAPSKTAKKPASRLVTVPNDKQTRLLFWDSEKEDYTDVTLSVSERSAIIRHLMSTRDVVDTRDGDLISKTADTNHRDGEGVAKKPMSGMEKMLAVQADLNRELDFTVVALSRVLGKLTGEKVMETTPLPEAIEGNYLANTEQQLTYTNGVLVRLHNLVEALQIHI